MLRLKFAPALGIAFLGFAVAPSFAEPAKPDVARLITPTVMQQIRSAVEVDIVRISIVAQNNKLKTMPQAEIDSIDKQWRAERENADKPLIAATLSNPLSVYLSRLQGRSLGLYAEIFIMDQNGLNVGQSSITSDFWQGDEAKFQKTYDVDANAVFIDEPEWDKAAKIWRAQASFTITDGPSARKIGAATIEFNLTELERRMQASF